MPLRLQHKSRFRRETGRIVRMPEELQAAPLHIGLDSTLDLSFHLRRSVHALRINKFK